MRNFIRIVSIWRNGYQPMSEYDPDALDESAEEADIGGSIEAEITDVSQDVAHNIFGEDTESDPDKEMLVVTAETDELDDPVEAVFSLPQSEQSWLNPRFGLKRFKAKYDQVPREGMTVSLAPNDNGFLDIDIPFSVMDSDD